MEPDACPHCPDGSCPGPDCKDPWEWENWIHEKPREELPAWAQRRKDFQEFSVLHPPYRTWRWRNEVDEEPPSSSLPALRDGPQPVKGMAGLMVAVPGINPRFLALPVT